MPTLYGLLGNPRVRLGHRWVMLTADRPTALLVYLAVNSDWVGRAALQALFWPEEDESTAQNNLRQLLKRVRTLGWAEGLEVKPDRVRFAPQTDLKRFEQAVAQQRWTEALRLYRAEFCHGLGLRESAPYQDWLEGERERVRQLWRHAILERGDELERQGEYETAGTLLERVLESDPLEEEALASWMRVTARAGHRTRALERFERFTTALQEAFGLEPLEATQALAAAIRRGDAITPNIKLNSTTPGGSSLSAPLLVGRDHEWGVIEHAWNAGQGIVIMGEAGLGKTRLMLEFAASKGKHRLVSGHPGDAGTPFETLRRTLKRNESTLTSLDATLEVAFNNQKDDLILLGDDLHLFDPASLETVLRVASPALEQRGAPHLMATAVFAALSPSVQTTLRRLEEANQIALIQLGPLPLEATRSLVTGCLGRAAPLADALHQYTGGNPGFVRQTLEVLSQQGMLDQTIIAACLPDPMPPPDGVVTAIKHRLQRLSPAALQLLRLAGCAPEDFRPDLAALVLDLAPLAQAALFEELESSGLILPHRFVGDVVPTVVRLTTPETVQVLLHHRIALALEQQHGKPERIAAHRDVALAGTP